MIVFLSPSKNMQNGALPSGKPGGLRYPEKTKKIAALLKKYQPWEFEHLLKLNPELAWDAFARYQDMDFSRPGVPALLAYKGLAFLHLNARDFTREDFAFAQRHVRILSAPYGMLLPKDGIQPYRLELRCKLRIDGKTLYKVWGDQIYRDLFVPGGPVINLASKEYSQLVTPFVKPRDELITCDFMTPVRGKLRTLPSRAKMARGEMTRFIVKNRLTKPEELKRFTRDGYQFAEGLSSSRHFVFIQHEGE